MGTSSEAAAVLKMARIAPHRGLARICICLVVWFLFAKYDITQWIMDSVGVNLQQIEEQQQTSDSDFVHHLPNEIQLDEEQMEMFLLISEQCLPKLVCELYSQSPSSYKFTDSEKSLMTLIGDTFLKYNQPSKYHYAAHFGQLIQGYEGQGCYNLYPMCPFSGPEVQKIARSIPLK